MSKTTKTSWQRFLSWFDQYGLLVIVGFLLAFIPLYPKIPLTIVINEQTTFLTPIEQYNVRVRFEDLLIGATGVIWLIQLWRKKIRWQSSMTWMIVAYLIVGFLSVLNALFFIKTVPLQPLHVGKTVLHFFRYAEYFSLFFFAYSAIQNSKQLKYLVAVMSATVAGIVVYGYGQRYFYWPVYSTMNREFSKGVRLYLTEHARVQSTFAGHYDLGAYLVVILPILLAFAFSIKHRLLKVLLHLVHFAGVWLLVVTASRTSFVAYLAGVGVVIGLMGLQKSGWWEKIQWSTSRGFAVGLMMLLTLMVWGQGMYDRLLQVVEGYPEVYQRYTEFNQARKQFVDNSLPFLSSFDSWNKPNQIAIPEGGISTEEAERIILSSDERPVKERPSDVYVEVPDFVEVEVATVSASGSATTTTIIEERDRVFSECALQRGLSLCIRLETLWPQAIAGFMRNPLFGSGYATLNKEKVTDFTEIDGTDNNFLRTLGETGLLGFITFYGAVALAIFYAVLAYLKADQDLKVFAIGFIAGSLGLLINAVYIDVFASSKVAYTYWMLAGILLASWLLHTTQTTQTTQAHKRKRRS